MVRLAQNFSMRYMLIDGPRNFGSVDGDRTSNHALHRMPSFCYRIWNALWYKTVNFVPNFWQYARREPVFACLPKLPNLLLMGSEGIAVGMAAKIPPSQSVLRLRMRSHFLFQKQRSINPGPIRQSLILRLMRPLRTSCNLSRVRISRQAASSMT